MTFRTGHTAELPLEGGFDGEWAEPEDSALLFQQPFYDLSFAWWLHQTRLASVQAAFEQPTRITSSTLRRPLTNEQSELNEIVVSLSSYFQIESTIPSLENIIPAI